MGYFKVGDKYRTNPLSHQPGGTSVIVLYHNGKKMEYTKVKHPYAFIKTVKKNPDVRDAWVENTE